jgi:WD40 repeat protein
MITTQSRFYHEGGAVPPDAPSYVVRQADSQLHAALLQGEFCYVLHARQMGKSSLMGRTAARLREEGVAVARLDLTGIGQNVTPEQWYFGLLNRIGEQLDLEGELEAFWLEPTRLGPLQRWMAALRQVVLARCPGRLVIFIDEIDVVRSLPFSTDEFFASIRECYNRRGDDPEFARLTFCLLGVATPSDLIHDTRTTPFNIGRRIELTDFTETEAALLAHGLDRPTPQAHLLLQRVLHWTAGHPYLTQRLCQAAAQDETVTDAAGVDRLCENLFLSPQAQEQDANLLFVRDRLLKSEADRAGLLDLYAQVRSGKPVRLDDTNQLVSILRLSGITRVSHGLLRVRNRIYERVFDREWVVQHMPDAELRRQQAAYRRGLLRAAAVAGVILALGAGLALTRINQARLVRQRDVTSRLAAQEQRLRRQYAYAVDMRLAQQAWEAGSLSLMQKLLEAQQPRSGQEDLRGFEWRYLSRLLQQAKPLASFEDPGQFVTFSADGRIMASGGGADRVTLRDTSTWRLLRTLRDIERAALSPDGKLLAAGYWKNVKLLDVATGRVAADLKPIPKIIGDFAFTPDGRILAVSDSAMWTDTDLPPDSMSEMRLWDVTSRRELRTIRDRGRMFSVKFSPDGKKIATAGADGIVELWSVASGRKLAALKGHSGGVGSVAFSPDGKMLASGGGDWTARLWDLSTLREVAMLQGQAASSNVAFSPDGKTLAMGGAKVIKLWDVATKHEVRVLRGHEAMVNVPAFAPRGGVLASASDDGTVKLWDVRTRPNSDILTRQQFMVRVAFSPDGKTLTASNGYWPGDARSGEVKLWDMATRRERATVWGRRPVAQATSLSLDGSTLAVDIEDGPLQIWSLTPRRRILKIPGLIDVRALAFSPDGKTLASGSINHYGNNPEPAVRLWDLGSHRKVDVLRGERGRIHFVAFSPDGKLLAWSDDNAVIRLWDLIARREVARLTGHTAYVNRVAFSPDGHSLASASSDHTVKLWDLVQRREIATLKGHLDVVVTLAFSPDGQELASGGLDHTVKLWNLASKLEVASLVGHRSIVTGLAFTPDGNLLASGDRDGTVRLWQAAPRGSNTDRLSRAEINQQPTP